jgi:polyphosphate kinase
VFWRQIRKELKASGIELVGHYDLSPGETDFLKCYFMNHVFPILSPLTVEREDPFPFIASGGICIVIELRGKSSNIVSQLLIRLPAMIPRFVRLPKGSVRFVALETMIYLNWDALSPNHAVVGSGIFQISRDNDLALEERKGDLLKMIESGLERRHRANGIRLKVNNGMPENVRNFVAGQIGILSDEEINRLKEKKVFLIRNI